MATTTANKLDFIPAAAEQGVLPSFELRSVGAAFAGASTSKSALALTAAKLSGRCAFVVREGFDPIDQSSTGRVVEGAGDAGITIRHGRTALSLTTNNLAYRAGLDDPLAAAQAAVGESSVSSFKITLASEYKTDCFVAASWDVKQRKPEVALAWSGETFTEQAAVALHLDPLCSTYKLSASVAFPGPEWRDVLYDERKGLLEEPRDDGARHRLWVQHTVRDRQLAYRTRLGAALDLGRLANWVADFVDYQVEPRLPPVLWRLPLLHRLYTVLVPPEDEDQVRHHIQGWDLEVSHDLGRSGPTLGVAKNWKAATLRGAFNVGAQEASLQYKRSGVSLTARLAKNQSGGGAAAGWSAPQLMLCVEPLGLL